MIRLRRRNTVWLLALAAVIMFALVAASVAPAAQFALIALFFVAAVASTVEIGQERETIIDALRRAPIRQRVSPQAREATERARSRGGFSNNDLMLLDVGVIAMQSSYEGMAMRRTRNISKDDDGVRPFVTLNIDPAEAERNATIRFEIYDQNGDQLFIHEMRTYLREGEMSVMTDHHLPLAGNRDIQGAGDWDMRVYIDGNLVGMHNFMLAPSMRERQRRLSGEAEMAYQGSAYDNLVDEVAQEVPPRLQDLLQGQAPSTPSQVSRPSGRYTSDYGSVSPSDEASDDSSTRRRTTPTRRRR